MGIFSKIFGVQETAKEIVSATISTGDKLFFTDEEKSDAKQKVMEYYPTLLKSYEPFKLAQRVLAMWFSFIFGISFLVGLGMTLFNIHLAYVYVPILNDKKEIINPLKLIDIQPLLNIISVFDIGLIVLAIVSFYFGGGFMESLKRKDK